VSGKQLGHLTMFEGAASIERGRVVALTETRTEREAASEQRSALLGALGRLIVRRPVMCIAAALLVTVLSGVFQADLTPRLSGGGFTPQTAESGLATRLLASRVEGGVPNLVLVTKYDNALGDLKMASALHDRIAESPGVAWVQSYWDNQDPDLRSRDGKLAAFLVRLSGDEHVAAESALRLVPEWERFSGWKLRATGEAQVNAEAVIKSEKDLVAAELVGAPLAVFVLWLVLGRFLAVLLPVAVGVSAVIVACAFLKILTYFVEVSVFGLNIMTALGFGLAVDYSLLLVNRYREGIADGLDPPSAVRLSVETAGRTVLFSAVTVSISLCALLLFPLSSLMSLTYAAVPVTLAAGLASITLLPASLLLFGERLFKARKRRVLPRLRSRTGLWSSWAHAVMRRPAFAAVPVIVVLLLLAAPFQHAWFSVADWETIPDDMPAHETSMLLRQSFPEVDRPSLEVALVGADELQVRELANKISTLPGVREVDSLRGKHRHGSAYYGRTLVVAPTSKLTLAQIRATARVNRGMTVRTVSPEPDRHHGEVNWISVKLDVNRNSYEARQLVKQVRALPFPGEKLVGGDPAIVVDTLAVVAVGLLPAAAVIVISTLLLLFLFTGSVLAPVKALIMNLFSLTASFGAMVYIFQDGNLKWLVGDFFAPGYVDATTPVMLFCIAFGLSMDYEILLLSRIREYYDQTGDNAHSVAMGLEKTGKLFTAGSIIIACTFGSLIVSDYSLLKLYGFGVALSVVVDAVLIRSVLVPAFMRIAGDWNWWAPKPLLAVYGRFGIRD
jgi:RND superfamily putative drug exporter